MSFAPRAAATFLIAVGAATATGGVASAAPTDPNSHNVYPTVPGVSQLPVPTGVAALANEASKGLSNIIYAGR